MRSPMPAVTVAIGLAALGSGPVHADRPEPVTLVVSTTFDDLPDEVTAVSGGLADDCNTATTEDTYFHAGPADDTWPTVSGSATLQAGKVLHCAGGDIRLRLVVRLDLTTESTSGRWVAVGGTGAYEGVRGNGTVTGSPFPGGIEDVYVGQLHGI